jgi:TRAP-type C4-dicarboxylate transport system permease small subunit
MRNFVVRNPFYATLLAVVIVGMLFGAVGAEASFKEAPKTEIKKVEDIFTKILQPIFNLVFWLLIVLAALFVIWSAFNYLTANGEPEKISQANRRIVYAGIAVAVAVLARAIPTVICNFISTSGCSISSQGLPE